VGSNPTLSTKSTSREPRIVRKISKPGMRIRTRPALFSTHFCALLSLYGVASFVHFAHNAEYIASYPNMPLWLSRENVYLAWLAVSGVGLMAVAFALAGWRVAAALSFALYGGLGLDALGHYGLARCSQHTLTMNLTIWAEALAGAALAVASGWELRAQALRRSPNVEA
jgi:hypothetical protein